MRRLQVGWETGDLAFCQTTTTSGAWSVAASTSAARTGTWSSTYGMRVSTTGGTGSGYVTWDTTTMGTMFRPVHATTSMVSGVPFIQAASPTEEQHTCHVRGYFSTSMYTNGSGTSTGATTGPPGTMTDSGASWAVDHWKGHVVTSGGKTLTVASNTATVITGTGGWSGGGDPGPAAYTIAAANNIHEIVRMENSGASLVFAINVQRSGNNRIFSLTGSGSAVNGTYNLPIDTKVRLEIHVSYTGGTLPSGWVALYVYAENSDTLLDSIVTDAGSTVTGDKFHLGRKSGAFQNGAINFDFDDWAINDDQILGSNIHYGRIGQGGCVSLGYPTSDGTSPTTKWTGSDGDTTNNYLLIDEPAGTAAATIDADYVTSAKGATLHSDLYGHTAWSARGSESVKSIALLVRHRVETLGGTNDTSYAATLYDGTQYVNDGTGSSTDQIPAMGDTVGHTIQLITEKYGGGAIDSSWYSGCSLNIRKLSNIAGINDKRVTWLVVEVEDDNAAPITIVTERDNLNVRQAVKRASIW